MAKTTGKHAPAETVRQPRPLTGLAIGVASGLIAAGMMNGMQAAVAAWSKDKSGSNDEPATVKAADKVSAVTTGQPISPPAREHAGQAVHYLTGAALGALYGVVAEYQPEVKAGFGTVYGAAVAVVLDDMIVPALGLGDAPWKSSPQTLAYGLVSHLVFGATLEGSRVVMAHGVE